MYKINKLTTVIKLLCLTPLYLTTDVMAASQTTTCSDRFDAGGNYTGSDCSTTYSGGGGGGMGYDLTLQNVYNTQVTHQYGNPFPDELDIPQIENELESQYDKTPLSGEKVGDLIQALANAKLLVNYLITTYKLSPEMVTKLTAAFNQANSLIALLNNGGQISNHLINQEWGYAGSEIATVLSGAILTGIAATSGSVIVTTGAMLLAGAYVLPEIEKLGDALLEEYNHEGLLNNINIKFGLPNIYELAEDAAWDLYCASLPLYKQAQIPGCMIPPIILDLDGNGIDFLTLSESKVRFDVNNDGVNDRVSWPTSGNGVLFADWNSSGIVDSRTEFMFSLYSIKKHASDLEGLKMFDYEDDGDIDAQDNIYEKLFIWNDKNEDGICSTNEVHSLNELGITLHFSANKIIKKEKHRRIKKNKIEHTFLYKASNFIYNDVKVKKGLVVSAALKAKIQ